MINITKHLILFLCILLSGCSGDELSSEDTPRTIFIADLIGTWEYCWVDQDSSAMRYWHYSSSQLVYETWLYESTDCSGEGVLNITLVNDIKIGDAILTESGFQAFPIDYKLLEHSDPDVEIGTRQYGLLSIFEDQLYSGDGSTGPGRSPETRPTDLNFNISFTRYQ